MSQTIPMPSSVPSGVPPVVRLTPDLYLAAARRLVSQENQDIDAAARRLIDGAARHDIDFSLCFGTLDRQGRRPATVRQACLAVRGAGRTAMMFLSEPVPGAPEPSTAGAERAACLEEACRVLAREHAGEVSLAQALPEPHEDWSLEALLAAGFRKVGDLAYLKRERGGKVPGAPDESGPWPQGVSVVRVSEVGWERAEGMLLSALDRTYIDTLDCPELCGLRETADVLDSHRKTGAMDPSLWWVVLLGGVPEGCMLLNRCPEQRAVELVYIGLGPALRGRGLGRSLLSMGLERVRAVQGGWAVTCAVDERNAAALRLYAGLGFKATARRTALVRKV